MKNSIYILFIGMIFWSACNTNGSKVQLVNDEAALPASFKFDSLGLKVMASFVDKKAATMSVLYANPLALKQATVGNKLIVAGEVFTLVTWKQQEDGHWFGGRIPGEPQSVELVKTLTTATGISTGYKKYVGKNLLAVADTLGQRNRIKYILDQQPSIMP